MTDAPQDPTKVVRPTDDEVTAVAAAMDVDNKLDWHSTEHTNLKNIAVAKEIALSMILGFRAVTGLAGFVSAMKAKAAKYEADREAAMKAQEAADKAAAAARDAAAAPVLRTAPPPPSAPAQQ
jgi:hypothetical protein